MPRARKKPTAAALEDQSRRIVQLLSRWLTLYEALLAQTERRMPEWIETATVKPPDLATLRELLNAVTLCTRLAALSQTPEGDTDAAALRRHLDAVERAISATAEEPQ